VWFAAAVTPRTLAGATLAGRACAEICNDGCQALPERRWAGQSCLPGLAL
jgi:hypothetical protein